MYHSKALFIGQLLLTLILPTSSSAASKPQPGKWEKSLSAFGFDEKTNTYLPIFDSKNITCLSEAYFQEKSFHVPNFEARESDIEGRQCVVSKADQSESSTQWQQICTDQNGSATDERWLISISRVSVELEHNMVRTRRLANRPDLEARNLQKVKFTRLGECDNQ
jgi:hypothetical protein